MTAATIKSAGDEQQPDLPLEHTFEHYCHCGKWGSFGYGVKLRAGAEGKWFCREHRPKREPSAPPSGKPASITTITTLSAIEAETASSTDGATSNAMTRKGNSYGK